MARNRPTAVFDSMENRQLFAYAGGISPAAFSQIMSELAIYAQLTGQMNAIAMPNFGAFPGYGGNDFGGGNTHVAPHRSWHQASEPVAAPAPATGESDSAGESDGDADDRSTATPTNTSTSTQTDQSSATTTSTQTQTLSLPQNDQANVPDVQATNPSRQIPVTSSSSSAPQIVAVKVLANNTFSSNLIDMAVSKVASELSPQIISSIASSTMATQRLLASTLLGDLKSGTGRAAQQSQTHSSSDTTEDETLAEENAEQVTESPLAIINPALLVNKNFLYRMAIGMAAFMVISYAWTRRLANRMQSVVLKNEDDMTEFDR